MIKDFNNFNPNYSYSKKDLTIQMSKLGYPIIEKTNNALLYPEEIKQKIDTPEMQ